VKLEGNIFAGVALFLIPVTAAYWYLSKDPTGTTALILTFGLCFLVAFYFLFTAKRIDERPEDDPHADIADGAGELGFFPPHSVWPLVLGAACALATLGIIFSWWLTVFSLPFVAVAVFGFMFEYYRGEHAH